MIKNDSQNFYHRVSGLPSWLSGKEPAFQYGDLRDASLISGSGRYLAGVNGNPLQYSCLENPHGHRSLVGYSPWGHKESDMD